ncbi:amidohydrolase family protein [Alsobacter sp. SYSU M60028]|uniref:Amidohydrolase family protein n=1 Tax=Alsobacter ponti TaxID=2962936 RepID=A0ABT1LGY2_9HYPH|nr:amidohydrolase family protein [Alsobacter ponti]MCP8940762.1 amidohydrolase family protein [Alsobacter ponti]
MSRAVLLRNVRPLGGPATDVAIVDGRFAATASPEADIIDGQGLLMLPGLVEAHTHLDKNLFGMKWYRNEIGPRRIDRIETDRREKKRLGIDPARQSMRQAVATLALGVTAIRTHVDVDTEIGVANVAGVLETREKLAGWVDIQIVAFPQSGMLIRPGTQELMEEALRLGADIVGGIDPASIDRDPVAHLDAVFAMAQSHGKPIDLHLHEPGELGAFCLELIVERTRALGMQGRVMVDHAYCLGMLEAATLDTLAASLADAGVAVMTAGPPGRPAPAVKRLREAGVVVCGGSDGPRGTWEPYGRGDMLQRATMIGQRNGFTRDEDLELALDVCTVQGARALGLAGYGLAEGCVADLVLVDAETAAEAVAAPPPRRVVVKAGRVVARDGETIGIAAP